MWGHSEKNAIYKPQRVSLSEPNNTGTWVSDFQSSEPWEINLWSESSILWSFVTAAQTKTPSQARDAVTNMRASIQCPAMVQTGDKPGRHQGQTKCSLRLWRKLSGITNCLSTCFLNSLRGNSNILRGMLIMVTRLWTPTSSKGTWKTLKNKSGLPLNLPRKHTTVCTEASKPQHSSWDFKTSAFHSKHAPKGSREFTLPVFFRRNEHSALPLFCWSFFHKVLQKNLNELFGQSDSCLLCHPDSPLL